jgi:Fur family peroxide stress response transcriptional regulator
MPTISLDTVYRTLVTFEGLGLVNRVHAFDDRARFDANVSPHQHLVCTECKSIQDFQWDAFQEMQLPVSTDNWGDVTSSHVVLRGTCKHCLEKDIKNEE